MAIEKKITFNKRKKHLFKLICLKFLFVFSSFSISQNIFAVNLFSGIRTFFSNKKLNKELLIAVQNEDTSKVQQLLQQGANPNIKSKNSQPLFIIAVSSGNLEITNLLLNAKANINIQGLLGDTPLHIAASKGYLQIAELLLEQGADINNQKNSHKSTPLYEAAFHNQYEMVDFLLNKGANPNLSEKKRKTPLYIATEHNKPQIVERLLQAKADPNTITTEKDSPLFWAVKYQRSQIISLLAKNGVNPFLDMKRRSDFLKRILESRNLDIIQLVFNNKDFAEKLSDKRKRKYIQFSIQHNASPEIVQLLMTAGPKIPLKSFIQKNLLAEALKSFERNNDHDPRLWSNHETINDINPTGLDILIPLMLKYKYEKKHEKIPSSVKELVQKVSNLNTTNIENIHDKTLLDSTKSLLDWITNQMSSIGSSEEFFKQIFQYLRRKDRSPEEQNLLLENIQYLLLHEYLLNPKLSDKSDFEQLKKDLKGIRLDNFQRFENHLRYIYAQELMGKFFPFVKEEDLIKPSYLRTQTEAQQPLTDEQQALVLKKFNSIHNLIDSMVSYCQDMNYSVTEDNPAVIETQDTSRLFKNASSIMRKTSTAVKNTSPVIKNVSEKTQALQNETIVKAIQWIPGIPSSSMPSLIENLFEQGYNQRVGKELYPVYKHLKHIIQTEGADLNSESQRTDANSKNPFTGKDILDLKK